MASRERPKGSRYGEQHSNVRDMGNNTAMFMFQNDADAERVIVTGPWSFDKHLIILTRMDASIPFSKASFTHMSFWVQIHDLPVKLMKKEASEAIGKTVGVVEQAEAIDEGRSKGNYMRIRVTLDIQQPLCRGRKIGVGGNKDHWVSFKYERLTNFCYWCGLITHGEKDCELWLRSHGSLSPAKQPYGAWMRGETERFGRKFPNAFDPNKGNQETQSEQGTTPARGWSEKTTVRKEPPVRIRVLEKEKDSLTSGPTQAPDTVRDLSTHREQIKESILVSQSNACMRYGHHVNGGAMFEENSKYGHQAHGGTILEETSEYGYHVNGGAMLEENSKYGHHAHGGTILEENSEYGYHVNGGALLEKTSKGQNVLVSTISGPLNDIVDMDSTTTSSPKSQNKPPSSTWKRSAGRKKSILYDVPVLHITGSKRNNEAILLGEDNGETGSKKAKGDTVMGTSLEYCVTAVADIQPRRKQ
jgi:hypothetical protein